MRSNDEIDKCIDLLISRIYILEKEVAELKGEPQTEEKKSEQTCNTIEIPDAAFISKTKPKRESNKAIDSSLENAIGTRWIGRIGVLAIIFGVAFFLKYSFDNKLIGETGRVVLGLLSGVIFLGTGEYLQTKKNLGLYGQMLSGCSLAVFYLSLYAAFALYHLVPVPLAAAGMLAVTTAGITLSIRYTAYSLAAIALLGGFLTPIMLSTGQNQPFTLFGYILLLDMGTLLLVRFRTWPSLVVASGFGTVLLYFGWHSEFYGNTQQWLASSIVLVFFILYNLHIFISRSYSENRDTIFDQIVIFGSAAFFFLAFFAQCHWEITWQVKIFTLGMAAVEVFLAMLVDEQESTARTKMVSYATVSVIMTVIATFIILEQRWIMPALTAEMVAMGWFGFKMDLPKLRQGAYLFGLLVLIRFAYDINLNFESFQSFVPVFNDRFLICATAVTGFYIFLYIISRYKENLVSNESNVFKIIFIITQALSLILLSVEVHDFFRSHSPHQILRFTDSHYAYQLSLSVLWALYASLLTGVGIFKRLREARILGILLLSVTIIKVFLIDLSELETFYRIISFVVLGLLLLAVSYGYNRFRNFIFGEDEP
ncbi:MAG: DUF2339 domain-containing protein [Smithellaceae bacterium]